MTDTVNVPLLPCPFCGSALSIRTGVNPYGHCPTEGCYSNRAQIVCLDVPEQVAAWNSRALLAAAPKAEPDYRKLVRDVDRMHEDGTIPPEAPKVEQEPCSACLECGCQSTHPEAPKVEQEPLTVWYGSMPESNGRENWSAVLHRVNAVDKWDQGFCFARSEYPERVLYEADRMRWIIGERAEKPDILDYDEKKHSGYTHPAPASDELLEALEPICREADCWPELTDDDVLSFATPEGSASPYDIKMGDIRRIAAIAKHKGPQS